MGAEEAREELRRVAGTQLDPRCVNAFLAAVEVTDTEAPCPEEVVQVEAEERRGLLGERRRAAQPEAEEVPAE
jgi:HD-GYP domain-containing protein (c-di-GMP phosphodiesterase class II)